MSDFRNHYTSKMLPYARSKEDLSILLLILRDALDAKRTQAKFNRARGDFLAGLTESICLVENMRRDINQDRK